jgi:hypothetical protein
VVVAVWRLPTSAATPSPLPPCPCSSDFRSQLKTGLESASLSSLLSSSLRGACRCRSSAAPRDDDDSGGDGEEVEGVLGSSSSSPSSNARMSLHLRACEGGRRRGEGGGSAHVGIG